MSDLKLWAVSYTYDVPASPGNKGEGKRNYIIVAESIDDAFSKTDAVFESGVPNDPYAIQQFRDGTIRRHGREVGIEIRVPNLSLDTQRYALTPRVVKQEEVYWLRFEITDLLES